MAADSSFIHPSRYIGTVIQIQSFQDSLLTLGLLGVDSPLKKE
jgi:hypothetical protein